MGGLGIINLKNFNTALLAKWYWQWHQPQQRLWKEILKEIYCHQDPLKIYESTFFSTHLKEAQPLCDVFMQKTPTQGRDIKLWKHDWGEGIIKNWFIALYSYARNQDNNLHDLLNVTDPAQLFEHTLTKKVEEELHQLRQLKQELQLRLGQPQQDIGKPIWKPQEDKGFSVKSAYATLCDTLRIKSNTDTIWKLKIVPKCRIFAFLLYNDRILTAVNLQNRGFTIAGMCYMCRASDEDAKHLFNDCIQSKAIINGVGITTVGRTATQQSN